MDTDQNSKFPLHEAARDGKRMIFDLNVLSLMLTFLSSNGRVALECKFRPAYSGMLSRYIVCKGLPLEFNRPIQNSR